MEYLHEKQYYIDRHDLWTIERCLSLYKTFREVQRSYEKEKDKPASPKDAERSINIMLGRMLFATKVERFQKKEEDISKWMQEDRDKQDFYDNTPLPSNAVCDKCVKQLVVTSKHFDSGLDEPFRLLFLAECFDCDTRKGIYSDGEIYVPKKHYCPKCNKEVQEKNKYKDHIITTKVKCNACGYKNTDTLDCRTDTTEIDNREKEDKEKLEKYRAEFCFNETEGNEAVEIMEQFKFAHEVRESILQKYEDPVFETTFNLKKIDITQLEQLVNKNLATGQFSNLNFGVPEIDRYVVIPFTTQDTKPNRTGHDSETALKEILKNTLEGTNWRIMKDSFMYRLGILTGKLKGYERQEDLMELYEKPPKKEQIVLDPEKEKKYMSSTVVQLAKLCAESEGENILRTKRLSNEPDGFLLTENSDGYYSCGICYQSIRGFESWWNSYGITCENCHRNILEGIISSEVCSDRDTWFSFSDFDHAFGIHPQTGRKLARQGVVKGTELKNSDGVVYYTIFLVKDNVQFLKDHPQKEEFRHPYYFRDKEGNRIWL